MKSLYQADFLFGVIQGTIHSKRNQQRWDKHHYTGIILWKQKHSKLSVVPSKAGETFQSCKLFTRSSFASLMQGMIFGLLFFAVLYKYILRIGEYCVSSRNRTNLETHEEKIPCFLRFSHFFVGSSSSVMDAICAYFRHAPILW